MCGRFTQHHTWRELHDLYELTGAALNLEPRYNIAPTTQVLTVRQDDRGRYAAPMRWGLIPAWWQDDIRLPATFNARSDTVAEKRMFRSAFKSRRCIIPASGFYEWKTEGKVKRPFYITAASGEPLSFAGLWEARQVDGEDQLSCTIITTDANATMEPIHNRMPVILGRHDLTPWLSGRGGVEMLKPCADKAIKAVEVSTYVSNVKNQGEKCIEPL